MTSVSLQWGLSGALDEATADCAVVVDVLSFTTSLSIAADRGTDVLALPWQEASAPELARQHAATLAVGRREAAAHGGVSLSPASIRKADGLERLVLPSPNGSAISFALASRGVPVVGACLRNAASVAGWIERQRPSRVVLVAAGERWPDGSMRPALEDLLGGGAVLDQLSGSDVLTPDAQAARAAFRDARADLLDRLRDCTSGQELIGMGFAEDIEIAAELDSSTSVPVFAGDRFRAG